MSNYQDGKPREIVVAIHLNGSHRPCGKITFNSLVKAAAFTYLPDYDGPPLDPIHLNHHASRTRHFPVNPRTNSDLLHRVFVDYLPGPWGLHVLDREHPELRSMKAGEKLHWFGSRTVGSLAFFVKHPVDETPIQGIDLLEEIRRRSVDLYIAKLSAIGLGRVVTDGLTSHGGARPKCIFEDRHGGQWLAKFNIPSDAYNFARVEHASSLLARRCGIDAVETRCLEIEPGVDVLFVRRYDRTTERRPHRISAFAMMREEIVRAQHEGDYQMIFDVLEKISCDPRAQREELLRRLYFNVATNNTDDHLKNFEFLLDEQRHCWNLSPAYDLTVDPYPNQRVTSVFGLKKPSLSDALVDRIVKHVPIDRERALVIRDDLVAEVAQWPAVFAACGVPGAQIIKLQRSMDFGLRTQDVSAPLPRTRPGASRLEVP